ncbi:dehydrogenase [bacterium I07]|nr:dehydrogenase [bacterium I07]
MKQSRRDFLKTTSAATAVAAAGGITATAKSYSRILGSNETMRLAIVGLHGRGRAHLKSLADCKGAIVSHICDVDQRELEKFSPGVEKIFGESPTHVKDFRKLLNFKELDAITIATPEHWHAPMAVMGLQAGKHVYLEKPCSHNPRESELLIKAQKKYKPLIQMGNQQRSSAHSIEAVQKIREGAIGEVYYGKAWYSNTRGPIGVGKEVPVPDYLDWELWQGPAPRKPYKDNVHPYNWHWFWHWGTGETLNNGTHEVDVCRWALGVDYPHKITADGGRYHYQDDWEFYDTIVTNFEYDNKMITWEGKSCNGKKYFNRGRGATIHGTEGTVLIDRDGYLIFDKNDDPVFEFSTKAQDGKMDVIGAGPMTTEHFRNFINAVKTGEKLRSPIQDAAISVNLLHLSNVSWKMGRSLSIDTKNGRIKDDKKAMKMWGREYEKGWELKV